MLNSSSLEITGRVAGGKLSGDAYDIVDTKTGHVAAVAVERVSRLARIFRVVLGREVFPARLVISEPEYSGGAEIFSIFKSAIFGFRFRVRDTVGRNLGLIHRPFISLGKKLIVRDERGRKIAEASGSWTTGVFELKDLQGQGGGTIERKSTCKVNGRGIWGNEAEHIYLLVSAAFAVEIIMDCREESSQQSDYVR